MPLSLKMSLKVPRTVVNQIISKAMNVSNSEILWGLFDKEQQNCLFFSCEPKLNAESLLAYAIIYNQANGIADTIEKLHAQMLEQQSMIEIFEDTKGVIGLRAYQKQGKMLQPLTLEIRS